MSTRSSPLTGALLSLASFGLYACCDVSLKYLGQTLSTVQVMWVSSTFTLAFILLQMIATERGKSLRPQLWGWTLARIAIILVNGGFVTYTFAHLPLAQCYAIFFTMPLIITLMAWPLLGEPIDPLRGLIILVGFAGVLVAVQPGSTSFQMGHLTAICGAVLGGLNSLILRRIGTRERPVVVLVYPVLAQSLVTTALLPLVWKPLTGGDLIAGTVLGLLGTVAGMLIIAAYRRAAAIVVAPMQYSQILWSSTLGWFLFREMPSRMTVVGIVIIVSAGLALLVTANRRPSQESPA